MKKRFRRISDAKIIKGVFFVPQITELIPDVKFEDQQSEVEKAAWNLFKNVTTIFLGNHKIENYRDTVADLVQSYSAMGCQTSLTLRLLMLLYIHRAPILDVSISHTTT